MSDSFIYITTHSTRSGLWRHANSQSHFRDKTRANFETLVFGTTLKTILAFFVGLQQRVIKCKAQKQPLFLHNKNHCIAAHGVFLPQTSIWAVEPFSWWHGRSRDNDTQHFAAACECLFAVVHFGALYCFCRYRLSISVLWRDNKFTGNNAITIHPCTPVRLGDRRRYAISSLFTGYD